MSEFTHRQQELFKAIAAGLTPVVYQKFREKMDSELLHSLDKLNPEMNRIGLHEGTDASDEFWVHQLELHREMIENIADEVNSVASGIVRKCNHID